MIEKPAKVSSVGIFRFTTYALDKILNGISSGDLNKDGLPDIAVAGWALGEDPNGPNNAPVRLLVLKQDSSGDFKLWSGFAGGKTTIAGTWLPLIGDFNGDGRGDIGVAGFTDYPVTAVSSAFFLSNGTSHYRVNYADKIAAHGQNLADINRDGLPDLITAGYGSERAGSSTPMYDDQYYISQRGGKPTAVWNTPISLDNDRASDMSPMGSGIAAGDLNNDGYADFVIGDAWDLSRPIEQNGVPQRADILVLKGGADGLPTGPYAAKITPYIETHRTGLKPIDWAVKQKEYSHDVRAHIADFDGDGLRDFLMLSTNFSDGREKVSSIRLYKNRGDFNFTDVTAKWLPEYKMNWTSDYSIQVKDFDRNGTVDIALSATSMMDSRGIDNSRHGNAMFLNDGSGRMHLALRAEYTGWAKQFDAATEHDVDFIPRFFAVETKGKVNFLVLADNVRSVNKNQFESVYGTLKVNINFNNDFRKSITVSGTTNDDHLFGWAGNDTLIGKAGRDALKGGIGKDRFVFNTALDQNTNVDTIRDFRVKDDTVLVDNAVFTKVGSKTGLLNSTMFHIGSQAHDYTDRIIYDTKKGALFYDADGIGGVDQIMFAKISKGLKMAFDDFVVV